MKGLVAKGALFALAIFLSGCGGFTPALVGEQRPEVRIFNAVDGDPIVVTYADAYGNLLGTSPTVAYQTVSTSNTIISNTTATPTILSNGAKLFTGTSQVYQINAHYTLYVGGTAGAYTEVALNDNQGLGPTAGNVDFRAVHVGASAGSVDVYVVPTGSGVNGIPVFSGLTYSHVSAGANTSETIDGSGYVQAPVSTNGLFDVILTRHDGLVAIAKTTVNLDARQYYTAVIYDNAGGAGVQVLKD